jgi:hypothetical protein
VWVLVRGVREGRRLGLRGGRGRADRDVAVKGEPRVGLKEVELVLDVLCAIQYRPTVVQSAHLIDLRISLRKGQQRKESPIIVSSPHLHIRVVRRDPISDQPMRRRQPFIQVDLRRTSLR